MTPKQLENQRIRAIKDFDKMGTEEKQKKDVKTKCPLCGSSSTLTEDHVVPKWIGNMAMVFGFNFNVNNIENIQYICCRCNLIKGGFIDLSTPLAVIFWTKVRDAITEKLNKKSLP